MFPFEKKNVVYADTPFNGSPVELFSIEKQKQRLVMASDNLIEEAKATMLSAPKWLPMFAEQYNISADIKDYVAVPVIIMPSDLPNINLQAFPYNELVKANTDIGLLGYQTWRSKPTFVDHVNQDHTKAKGIVLSSAFRPIVNSVGNVWKVICLVAYDRKRDPMLVNSILTGERKSYSMGAWVSHFTCSVCSAMCQDIKKPPCEHLHKALSSRKMLTFEHKGKPKLAYLNSHNFFGFEVSSVVRPAYTSATPDLPLIKWN